MLFNKYFQTLNWTHYDVGDLIWFENPKEDIGLFGAVYLGITPHEFSWELSRHNLLIGDALWWTINERVNLGYPITLQAEGKILVINWWPSPESFEEWQGMKENFRRP